MYRRSPSSISPLRAFCRSKIEDAERQSGDFGMPNSRDECSYSPVLNRQSEFQVRNREIRTLIHHGDLVLSNSRLRLRRKKKTA